MAPMGEEPVERDPLEGNRGSTRRISRRRTTVAITAAIVLAIGGGAALIAARHSQADTSPTASASAAFDFETGGWGWRRVADPAPGLVARIGGGFLGECVAKGLPVACTSKDAVSWTLPADPAVLDVDAATAFAGWSVAHGAAGWVAAGTVDPGTWRSSDGLHWSAVAVDLPGLQRAQVQTLGDGFVMVAQVYDGQRTVARLLSSTGGETWTPLELPSGVSAPEPGGAIGLVAHRGEPLNGAPVAPLVSSSDGHNWTALTLPDGVYGLTSTISLEGGTYVGIGTAAWTYGAKTLLVSADGVVWHAATGIGSPSASLAVVGQRVLAVAGIPSSALTALWASTDGTTWQRIATLDGNPLSGTEVVSLGDRVGLMSGSKLLLVGFPPIGGTPTASVPPSATPSAGESPTASPPTASYVVGGWRWHELDRIPGAGTRVVRIANGYLGRCGDSMCTSNDGWSWQTPPDPAIFSADATAVFTPSEIAHRPGAGYVILAEGLWYSADGVRWEPSATPDGSHGFMGLAAGAFGFAAVGEPSSAQPVDPGIYVSADGASWTVNERLTYGTFVDPGGDPDTSAGLLANMPKANKYLYSADGRTWATASVPAGTYTSDQPHRLADGSLLTYADGTLLRSSDGRTWTKLARSFEQGGSMVVSNGRLVIVDRGSGVAWESSDSGRTFHKLMDGAASVEQFGDLVLLRTSTGGRFVGAPLSASEAPGTTPTAAGLPPSSAAPGYTPPPTPSGGISQEEAIRIAVNATHPPADQVAKATASAEMDPRYGRWIWSVSFLRYYEGPLNAGGTFVDIDFFTGEVLASGDWIS